MEGRHRQWQGYGIPLYLYQMAIYYNKDLVKKYNLQYILDDGFVTIDEIKDLKGKLPKGTYALTYGNLRGPSCPCCTARAARLRTIWTT